MKPSRTILTRMALCAMVLAATLGRAQSIEDAQALVSEGKWKEARDGVPFHYTALGDLGGRWLELDDVFRRDLSVADGIKTMLCADQQPVADDCRGGHHPLVQ